MESKILSKYVRIFGMGEALVENKIIDLIDNQTNPTIAPYVKEGETTLRVTANCKSDEEAENIINPVINEIKSRIGDFVYSTENKDLEILAGELLIKNNITISMAESCTGGLVSSILTNIPGISAVFDRTVVTYSNEAKIQNCNVKPETLGKHGAVSRETAEEMAAGIRKVANTDLGLSVTGIAGPGGGTETKPVGLVYVALSDKDEVVCRELRLRGDRSRIRNLTALNAFDMIRRYILKLSI